MSIETDVTLENFTTEKKALLADQYFIIGSLGRLWKKSIAMNLIREADAVAICEASEKQNPAVWSDQGCRMYFRFTTLLGDTTTKPGFVVTSDEDIASNQTHNMPANAPDSYVWAIGLTRIGKAYEGGLFYDQH